MCVRFPMRRTYRDINLSNFPLLQSKLPPLRVVVTLSHIVVAPLFLVKAPFHIVVSLSHLVVAPIRLVAALLHVVVAPLHLVVAPARLVVALLNVVVAPPHVVMAPVRLNRAPSQLTQERSRAFEPSVLVP